MNKGTRKVLSEVAKANALLPFHGYLNELKTNLEPLIRLFPKWNIKDADKKWCAAFVYYCCVEAGFDFPYSPDECVTCSLAGCGGWEEFATYNKEIEYYYHDKDFIPEPGDIIIYDFVFENKEHDHIGIIIENNSDYLLVAEGNVGNNNTSALVKRPIDNHIRSYIRIPDGYQYKSR